MRLLGVIIISLAPLVYGIKKYFDLVNVFNTKTQLFNIFSFVINEIGYTSNELWRILEKENTDFFVKGYPITLNEPYLKESGLNSQEISSINELLLGLQEGDREYIARLSKVKLQEIKELQNNAKNELKQKGKVYLTTFFGFSLMVFLALV